LGKEATQTTNQWYLKLVIPQAQCLQVSLLPSQLLEWEWVWQLADWTRCSIEISMIKVVQGLAYPVSGLRSEATLRDASYQQTKSNMLSFNVWAHQKQRAAASSRNQAPTCRFQNGVSSFQQSRQS